MKPHILIPLLVVCVGLPVVAMGTYYVCDNFPVAEGMRKREVQYKEDIRREAERIKEERRLARERAEEERRQRELAEKRAEEERRQKELAEKRAEEERRQKELAEKRAEEERRQKELAEKLAIRGVSINLPYEQLKQELAKKFGGIRQTDHEPIMMAGAYAFKHLDYYNGLINALSSRKTTRIYFNEDTAFGGKITLFPNCIRIQFPNEEQLLKYFREVVKRYAPPNPDTYTIDNREHKYSAVENTGTYAGYEVATTVLNDGIIHITKCVQDWDKGWNEYFIWYFGKSRRDYYMKEKGRIQREEAERDRKRKARDAEGI